jgi:hypothetical protein
MKKHLHAINLTIFTSLVLMSCTATQSTTNVVDDVYFTPTPRNTKAIASTQPFDESGPDEDYYDATQAKGMQGNRDYYDVAYNDPYYYNYGRFGFNSGLGMGGMGMGNMGWGGMGMGNMGWGGMGMGPCGWGMNNMGWGGMGMGNMGWGGMGMGMGMGMGSMGWGGMGNMGWGGMNNMGWGGMGMGWNDPWMRGNCGGGGWGMGNYWGPMGNCLNCYAPVVLGGSSNTYIGQRPSMGSGRPTSGGSPGGTTNRAVVRDPVSLDPVNRQRAAPSHAAPVQRTAPRSWEQRGVPASQPQQQRERTATPSRSNNIEYVNPQRRTTPERSGGMDRGSFDSGRSTSPSGTPSPGGGRSPGTTRPR